MYTCIDTLVMTACPPARLCMPADEKFADIESYTLPEESFLGFTARTGGATNNHWVRAITMDVVPIEAPSPAAASCTIAELSGITDNFCPAAPAGATVPEPCPPACAAEIAPWFSRCRRDDAFTAIDSAVKRDLLRYNKLCMAVDNGGGH